MFYSPWVKKASVIAFDAHKDDVDKGGYPYVMHPFFLAFQMDEENAVCVALLHDVIEDHGDKYSFEKLKEEGFNEEIITALKLLTHDKAVPYMDYVKEIGKNELARKVKIADLKHNSDASRLNGNASKKYGLYKQALEYLTSLR
ncbi:MAG: GTP pyrophosphokinase [Eubacteriales bacterium]|nr:GTP pyrophosphokinase [Eubacteriales bacterium]